MELLTQVRSFRFFGLCLRKSGEKLFQNRSLRRENGSVYEKTCIRRTLERALNAKLLAAMAARSFIFLPKKNRNEAKDKELLSQAMGFRII